MLPSLAGSYAAVAHSRSSPFGVADGVRDLLVRALAQDGMGAVSEEVHFTNP